MRFQQAYRLALFPVISWAVAAQAQEPYLVKDIAVDETESSAVPEQFLQLGPLTFFVAEDDQHGEEIWLTDGSTEGTRMLLDFYPGPKGSDPRLLDAADGLLFFVVRSPVLGWGLWQSDGELAGTRLLKDFPEASPYLSPVSWLRRLGDQVVFAATVSRSPNRSALFLLDLVGGEARQVVLCSHSCWYNPGSPWRVGRAVYFSATSDEKGRELWRTDGSVEGTALVQDLCPGECDGFSGSSLADINGALYFVAQGSPYDQQVWRTDGTTEGTVQLSRIGDEFGVPRFLTPLGDQLYFVTRFDQRYVPWKTDGTALSAQLASELMPYGTDADLRHFLSVGSRVFFILERSGSPDTELWVYDADADVTQLVRGGFSWMQPAASLPDSAVFRTGGRFWVSDGTSAGTYDLPVSEVRWYQVGRVGERIVFDGVGESTGRNLWISDGTVAGTRILKDIRRPFSNAYLRNLVPFQGHLYFSTYFPGPSQIWRSDGTEVGTENPDPGIVPSRIAATADRFFISGRGPGELWVRTATDPAVQLAFGEFYTWRLAPTDSLLYFSTWSPGRRSGAVTARTSVAIRQPGAGGRGPQVARRRDRGKGVHPGRRAPRRSKLRA